MDEKTGVRIADTSVFLLHKDDSQRVTSVVKRKLEWLKNIKVRIRKNIKVALFKMPVRNIISIKITNDDINYHLEKKKGMVLL